ncbi:GmrSD restriction endonuclease domain-containing protein [Streptomyces sp. URMC 126]|uniref:GmrSD restriction endonuclease domain-containing protein n=1 Tax=Streptomyces sp. URMC 126 TaxID=3423401 RepID=UPI003F1D514A
MSITPRGMSIQEAYSLYRSEKLIVNRNYQRKLVWGVDEKAHLIDSILRGFPVPLFLLAETLDGKFEIIDGMQRLDAVFGYIEHRYAIPNANGEREFFDLREFSRARQLAETGAFEPEPGELKLLPATRCADLLDYQLAVTIFDSHEEKRVTEVFRRINSGGRQLSAQEKRQAGVVSDFVRMVRKLASDFRYDGSPDIIPLTKMPVVSIDSARERLGYGIAAEETFWCSLGILNPRQLQQSEDEQLLADICISVVRGNTFSVSSDVLDKYFEPGTTESASLAVELKNYGTDTLADDVKNVLGAMKAMVESERPGVNGAFRSHVSTSSFTSAKTPFYAVFMAFYDLMIRQQKQLSDPKSAFAAIRKVSARLTPSRNTTTEKQRQENIDIVRGLLQKHFTRSPRPALSHGPAMEIEFPNIIRRAPIESARYEFKQGIVSLYGNRSINQSFLAKLSKLASAIANVGPEADGYIVFGVADSREDATRIEELDSIKPISIGNQLLVGVDRECRALGIQLSDYTRTIIKAIQQSPLSEPLKGDLLANVDTVSYSRRSYVVIRVPVQNELASHGEEYFVRDGEDLRKMNTREALAAAKRFSRQG